MVLFLSIMVGLSIGVIIILIINVVSADRIIKNQRNYIKELQNQNKRFIDKIKQQLPPSSTNIN